MALGIDASTPSVAVNSVGSTATVTTASFAPPAGSLLLPLWAANSQVSTNPGAPSITDNLGAHLGWALNDWQSHADSPNRDGQAASWDAPDPAGGSLTVTVTNGAASGSREAALAVVVLTGADSATGAHGKSGSGSAGSIAQGFTAQRTGSWGFLAVADWDLMGAMTAGTGCTLIGSANVGSAFTYGFVRRTTADGVAGNTTTMNVTLGGTSTNVEWVWIEVLPALDSTGGDPQLDIPIDVLMWLVALRQGEAQAVPAGGASLNGDAPLTVTATITADAAVDRNVDAGPTFTATVAATAAADRPISSATTTTATITPTAAVTRPVDTAITETATVAASAAVDRNAQAAPSFTATISPGAAVDRNAAAARTETATIAATAAVDRNAQAALTATASIVATAEISGRVDADAALTVTASRTATAAVTAQAQAALIAQATISPTAAVARTVNAALTAQATITASAEVVPPFTPVRVSFGADTSASSPPEQTTTPTGGLTAGRPTAAGNIG